MRSIESLVREARATAKWRGHSMPPVRIWRQYDQNNEQRGIAQSECRVCKAFIQCETHPAPNGIDIGGSAVAVNCPEEKDRY